MRSVKAAAIPGACDLSFCTDPEGIGYRKGRGDAGGVAGLKPRDNFNDMRRGDTASGDIMDQDMRDIATACSQILKPVAHRVCAGVAAGGDLDIR